MTAMFLIASALAAAQPQLLTPVWIASIEYPSVALAQRKAGTAALSIMVDIKGKPRRCTITNSSGSDELDKASCAAYMKHAHFKPARDEQGHAVEAEFKTEFVWNLPY